MSRKNTSPAHTPLVERIEAFAPYAKMKHTERPEAVAAAVRFEGMREKAEKLARHMAKWQNDSEDGTVQSSCDKLDQALSLLAEASEAMIGFAEADPEFDTGWEKTTNQSSVKFAVGDLCAIKDTKRKAVSEMLQGFGQSETDANEAVASLHKVTNVISRNVAVMLPGSVPFMADSTYFVRAADDASE